MRNKAKGADQQLTKRNGFITDIGELVLANKWTVVAWPKTGFQTRRKVLDTKIGAQPRWVCLWVVVGAHGTRITKLQMLV